MPAHRRHGAPTPISVAGQAIILQKGSAMNIGGQCCGQGGFVA